VPAGQRKQVVEDLAGQAGLPVNVAASGSVFDAALGRRGQVGQGVTAPDLAVLAVQLLASARADNQLGPLALGLIGILLSVFAPTMPMWARYLSPWTAYGALAAGVALTVGALSSLVLPGRLRARVAERLLASQQENAILTTFNEVNMKPIMDLRAKYKEKFEKEHGVKLGFMSFFVKAAVAALKKYPVVNASVDGKDIVYHGYFDIGIAIGSPRGLVVPILRDADQMSIADIEQAIVDYAKKAKDGKIAIEDLTGGTFSITNGGTFGSMMSTPIINPPQSAILGMHATKERAVVENGQVVVRPMMYLALSYDHRIIDGREAVLTLVAIKDALEDPARLLLDL